MINLNSKKGITLISLVTTIVLLLILAGTTIYSINSYNGVGKYKSMIAAMTDEIKRFKTEWFFITKS